MSEKTILCGSMTYMAEKRNVTNAVISIKTLIIKSLLPSLCQREEMHPSLVTEEGQGEIFK